MPSSSWWIRCFLHVRGRRLGDDILHSRQLFRAVGPRSNGGSAGSLQYQRCARTRPLKKRAPPSSHDCQAAGEQTAFPRRIRYVPNSPAGPPLIPISLAVPSFLSLRMRVVISGRGSRCTRVHLRHPYAGVCMANRVTIDSVG
jgi:hypothetical protein